jgi:DNA-binding NarL/FixJ family response regulator
MTKIAIIIVDDHVLFSQALNGLIQKFDDYTVLAQLHNGQQVINYFEGENEKPEIVLMDVNMPILNGIEATAWLHKHHPDVKVLALTMNDDEPIIINMLCAGACGYLLKDIHPNTLKSALNKVVESGVYYTDKITDVLIKSRNHKPIALKEREMTFLKLACSDMSYKQIADKMCLSYKTIDGYRDVLFDKFNVSSRVGMVLFALKEKIVTL